MRRRRRRPSFAPKRDLRRRRTRGWKSWTTRSRTSCVGSGGTGSGPSPVSGASWGAPTPLPAVGGRDWRIASGDPGGGARFETLRCSDACTASRRRFSSRRPSSPTRGTNLIVESLPCVAKNCTTSSPVGPSSAAAAVAVGRNFLRFRALRTARGVAGGVESSTDDRRSRGNVVHSASATGFAGGRFGTVSLRRRLRFESPRGRPLALTIDADDALRPSAIVARTGCSRPARCANAVGLRSKTAATRQRAWIRVLATGTA